MCNSTGCRCICTKCATRRSRCRVVTRSKRTCMHMSMASAWLLSRRGHCSTRSRVALGNLAARRYRRQTRMRWVHRRAAPAGIATAIGNHTLYATDPHFQNAPKQADYFAASIRRRVADRRAANLASTSTAGTKFPVLAEARDRSILACSQASYSVAFCCRIT